MAEGELAETLQRLDSDRENLFDTVRARRRAYARIHGQGAVSYGIESAAFGLTDATGAEEAEFASRIDPYNLEQSGLTPQDVADIRDYLRRSAEANEEVRRVQQAKATTRPE